MNYKLIDLIDVEKSRSMLESFCEFYLKRDNETDSELTGDFPHRQTPIAEGG